MGTRSRRLLLHSAAAFVLAGASILVTGAVSRADDPGPSPRPDVFSGQATASTFHFFLDRTPGLFPLTDIFHVEVPYSTSSFDSSGTISSRSALIYPGGGLLGAPGLICGQLAKCPFTVPAYPLIADANFPTKPDSSAETSLGTQALGGILSVQPNLITAHADNEGVDARTAATGLSFLDALTTGTVTSESHQYFKNGALVVTAITTVHDLALLGGLLDIGAITSTSTSIVDGGRVSQTMSNTVISGAAIAGVPLTIDDSGIHISSSGDNGALAKAVNSALASLKSQGVSIRLASQDRSVRRGNVSSSTGGLLIAFERNTPGVPLPIVPTLPLPVAVPSIGGDYVGSITIGGAGTAAYAAGAVGSSSIGSNGVPPAGGSLGTPTSGGGIDTGPVGEPTTAGPDLGVPSTGTDTLPPPALAPGQAGVHQAASIDKAVGRFKTFALVLVGYPLLILIGSVFRAPSRLPRWGGRA